MSNQENKTPFSSHIPEVDIIDLDKEPVESLEDESLRIRTTGEEEDSYEIDEEDETSAGLKSWFFHAKWHLAFFAALVCIIVIAFVRILNYGVRDDLDNYESDYQLENFDNFLPVIPKDGVEIVDDGVTTIVAFGNSPFADDKGSADNLASIIAQKTNATIHNLSFSDSYLCARSGGLYPEEKPLDVFNFYWLTTAFCLRNAVVDTYDKIFEKQADVLSQDDIDTFYDMMALDFNTVDVITIMYDASDYLAGHAMYDDQNPTNIYTFTGNLEAGIELIQYYYPHIRIIVMTPTYAYAVNENGEYISSDQYRYGEQDVLSTYVLKEIESAYHKNVSIVDHLYGTIHEDIASDYLIDHLHLNLKGKEFVADRFIQALTYYD